MPERDREQGLHKRREALCVCPAAAVSPSCPVHGAVRLPELWSRMWLSVGKG